MLQLWIDDGEDFDPNHNQYEHEDATCMATGRPVDDEECPEDCGCPNCRPDLHDPAEQEAGRPDRAFAAAA